MQVEDNKNNIKKNIKRFLYKDVLKPSERLCSKLIKNTNELKIYKTNLGELLENAEYGYQKIDDPTAKIRNRSKERWDNYLTKKNIDILEQSDIYNIAYLYSCINDDNYWDILDGFISEKLVFILIRNIHYYWSDLYNLDYKIDKLKKIILKITSPKKIFNIWKSNIEIILGSKQKNLLKFLLQEIKYDINNLPILYEDKKYDLKKTDLISCLIYYEYLNYLYVENDNVQNLSEIYKYTISFLKNSQRPNFRAYEPDRPDSKTLQKYQDDIISRTIIKFSKCGYFNNCNNPELNFKEKLIEFLIKNYGDPRENTYKWNNFNNKDALSILKGWLNEKDIRFFFENLVEDNQTAQGRKEFWIDYCSDKVVEDAKYIFSTETLAYKLYKNNIIREYNKCKNKKMFYLPKLKTNIFIMKIKHLMIVEFSETGNACYIYDYDKYKDAQIDSILYSQISREKATVDNFKNKNIALDIIKHKASMKNEKDWQENVKRTLNKYLNSTQLY